MKSAIALVSFLGLAGVLAASVYLSQSRSDDSFVPEPVVEGEADRQAEPTPSVDAPDISETAPWPKVAIADTDYYFGRMQVGQEREHSFIIRNEGDADLELVPGQATCKCTAFEVSRSVVPPGEEAELLVRWHGKLVDPSFQHGGPVYTNDPNHNPIRVTVQGVVDEAIRLRPEGTWDVGEVPADAPATMRAALYSNIYEKMEITSLTAGSEHVTLTAEEVTPERLAGVEAISGFEITVRVSPEIPPGPFEDKITIVVDQYEKPIIVGLTGRKPGEIQVLPLPGVTWQAETQGLTLGRFPIAEGRTAKLLLIVDESEMEGPFELTEVTADPSFIDVTLTPLGGRAGSRARYYLNVKVPPGIPPMERNKEKPAVVLCKTNHPTGEVLQLKLAFKSF